MKVIAVGTAETTLGFMLAGIKDLLTTNTPEEALKFFQQLEEQDIGYLIIIEADLYEKVVDYITEVQERKPNLIFYKLSGEGFKWRTK